MHLFVLTSKHLICPHFHQFFLWTDNRLSPCKNLWAFSFILWAIDHMLSFISHQWMAYGFAHIHNCHKQPLSMPVVACNEACRVEFGCYGKNIMCKNLLVEFLAIPLANLICISNHAMLFFLFSLQGGFLPTLHHLSWQMVWQVWPCRVVSQLGGYCGWC